MIFDRREWTVIRITHSAITEETNYSRQWADGTSKREAADAARHLNAYYSSSDRFTRTYYQAMPVEEADQLFETYESTY